MLPRWSFPIYPYIGDLFAWLAIAGFLAITAWVVQVGRFSTEANATALRDKLRRSGYASFAEPDYEQGAKSVRVLVGPELQRADAETLRAQLKQRLKLDAFVVSYP